MNIKRNENFNNFRDPIITENRPKLFSIPFDNKDIDIEPEFSTFPPPKLVRYGFNHEGRLNITNIIKNPYYKNGLPINFERTDEYSPKKILEEKINIKDSDLHVLTIIELEKVFSIDLTGNNIYSEDNTAISKITKKKNNNIYFRYADIPIDENGCIHIIYNNLNNLFKTINIGGNMIIQLFSCETDVMAQLIQFFISKFTKSYFYVPMLTSSMFEEKYLVLLDCKNNSVKELKKLSDSEYLFGIGIKTSDAVFSKIQSVNSVLLPEKICVYGRIKKYLDSELLEGATYTHMLQLQNNNLINWIKMFIDQSSEGIFNELSKEEYHIDTETVYY